MTFSLKIGRGLTLALATTTCLAAPAALFAQDNRADLFQAMLAAPNDPAAMLAFARAATAERDYEAVVSTLERLLDIEPGNAEARYELAIAYYALGSYEIAEFHFRFLQEQTPSAPRAKQIGTYLDRIDGRNAASAFSGEIAAGAAHTDNGTAAVLSGQLRWNADLGAANDHTWQTDLRFRAYGGDDDVATSRFRLRTGPRLSADGLAFGIRIRPYVEAEKIDDSDGNDYATFSFGAQYFNPHNAYWSSFADLKFGVIRGSGGASDGQLRSLIAGASYTPSRATRLRLSVFYSEFDTDAPAENYDRWGVRADLRKAFSHANNSGKRPSIGTAYLQHSFLDYEAVGRDDKITSIGATYRTFLRDDVFVEFGGRYTKRDSSVNALDESTPIISILVGSEF